MRYWLLKLAGSGFGAICKLAGNLWTSYTAISFSSNGLPGGNNSGRNEQKELICFEVFYGIVLKYRHTHDF
jgi:hypothetical protein